MTPPLIGLTGRKRSGKDTFAARLIERHGYERVSFADPLKAAALALDPLIDGFSTFRVTTADGYGTFDPLNRRLSEVVAEEGWEAAKERPEVRRTLQRLGVAIRDHVDRNAWLNAAADTIAGHRIFDGTPVVVTDVRFPNEAEWIRSAGGSLVRIVRPGLDTSDEHVSETALDTWPTDYTVDNGRELVDLYHLADAIARDVMLPPAYPGALAKTSLPD